MAGRTAAAVAAAAARLVFVVAMAVVDRPTRDELLAIYRAGPATMLALVEALLDRIAALERAHAALEAANTDLAARVTHLEARLAQDSHNSSKPPSSDLGRPPGAPRPPGAQPRRLRPPPGTSGRQTGGQPGHPGTTLRLVDTPDRLELHRPAQCATCGVGLDGARGGAATQTDTERVGAERRQVVDLPPLALHVTEHRVVHVACPAWGGGERWRLPGGCDAAGAGWRPPHGRRGVPARLPAAALRPHH